MAGAARILRLRLGILLYEWSRYRRLLSSTDGSWMHICNRNERLAVAEDGPGAECLWRWTSALHAPKYFPGLGRRLYERATAAYPIRLLPLDKEGSSLEPPDVSFVIGHRGRARLPQLLACLRAMGAQIGVTTEVIVVEQSAAPEIHDALPKWVRYVHCPSIPPSAPYNRARALNAGAELANAPLVVLHDGDLLAPACYARDLFELYRRGFEVINLKRFIFYLGEEETACLMESGEVPRSIVPETVLQNATGGGSLAVARQAYDLIGGHDEAFVGWGGEDVDFWDRARTLRVYPFAHLPLIHLWHPSQPDKTPEKDSVAMRRLARVSKIPVEERIAALRARRRGEEVARH